MVTLEKKLARVRKAWNEYQKEASEMGTADTPALARYWKAVRSIQDRS